MFDAHARDRRLDERRRRGRAGSSRDGMAERRVVRVERDLRLHPAEGRAGIADRRHARFHLDVAGADCTYPMPDTRRPLRPCGRVREIDLGVRPDVATDVHVAVVIEDDSLARGRCRASSNTERKPPSLMNESACGQRRRGRAASGIGVLVGVGDAILRRCCRPPSPGFARTASRPGSRCRPRTSDRGPGGSEFVVVRRLVPAYVNAAPTSRPTTLSMTSAMTRALPCSSRVRVLRKGGSGEWRNAWGKGLPWPSPQSELYQPQFAPRATTPVAEVYV